MRVYFGNASFYGKVLPPQTPPGERGFLRGASWRTSSNECARTTKSLPLLLILAAVLGSAFLLLPSMAAAAPPPASAPARPALGSDTTQTQDLEAPVVPRMPPRPPPAKKKPKTAGPPKRYVPPALDKKISPKSNIILPPLYGWTRIVMHDLQMPASDEVVNNCGMKQDMIFQFFTQRLQDAGVPIVSVDQAARLIPDVVTVEAEPSITSMQDLVINCISYVQLRVKIEMTFRVPPMMYRRTVPLLLWNDGVMVSSAKSTHNGALISAFIAMADRFRKIWNEQNSLEKYPEYSKGIQ